MLISGQGEPITTRGSQATMLRAFGQLTDLRTHWGVSSLWAIRRRRHARLLPPDPKRLRTRAPVADRGLKITPWPEVSVDNVRR